MVNKSYETVYTHDEVYSATLEYFGNDDLATNVWVSKYCKKTVDDDNKTVSYYELTPDDMHHRLASEFYRAGMNYNNPLSYDTIYNLFKQFKFVVPQGRPMAGIGVDDMVSISNCFVIGKPGQDSYGTIMTLDQELVQLSKRGGGVGTDLSDFRPNGYKVTNAAKTSSGPVELCANRFSNTIREVGQSGRRGALMLSMDINHPNAEEFMDSKMVDGKITGANISLKFNDEWLKEVVDNPSPNPEKLRLWNKFIYNNTQSAEPGSLFWSTILRESVSDCYADFGFKTVSTNPCGEIILSPYDSCRLILMNLFSYVNNPFTTQATFDFNKFANDVRMETKLMDNMIDLELEKIERIINKVNNDPEEDAIKKIELELWDKIKGSCLMGRRSGLGFTSEGDMLAAMGLRYGTQEATEFATLVQKIMSLNVYNASCDLVQVDGRDKFGCFDYELEKNNPFLLRLATITDDEKNNQLIVDLKNEFKSKWAKGRRNIALLTVSPAGSVSCLTQTTSGIEPLFLPKYKRKRKIDKNSNVKSDFIDKTGDHFIEFNVVHRPIIQWYAIYKNISFKEALSEMEKMSDIEFDNYYEKSPYYKATSNDCDWREKVRMQGQVQTYVDHSISITQNLPKGTTEDTVRMLYETAWKEGCKGCTVYVDGSRDGVLTSSKETKSCKEFMDKDAPRRPKSLPCKVIRFSNGGEKWIAAVGLFDGKPYEIFTGLLNKLELPNNIEEGVIIRNKVKKLVFDDELNQEVEKDVSRYDIQFKSQQGTPIIIEGISSAFNKEYWNYGKLISGLLRHSMPLSYIIKVISSLGFKEDGINTWKKGIIRALKQFMKDGVETGDLCPECSTKLTYESGCIICKNCGHSKCG